MAASRKPTAKDEPNRRAEIVRAASRLFAEKGYAATPIRDIARAVDMQSGSPFYHFKTKHDMLKAVALEGIAGISRAKLPESGPGPNTDFTRIPLHPFVDVYGQIAQENRLAPELIQKYE